MGATGINQLVQIFNGVKQLDTTLIRRSNDVSAFDMGDSINKEYLRNVALINNLNLSDICITSNVVCYKRFQIT